MAIYGLKCHSLGQTSYYSGPDDRQGIDQAIVEEEGMLVLAKIISGPMHDFASLKEESLPEILRLATPQDISFDRDNAIFSREAAEFCRQCIINRQLEMKLVNVEVFFDRSKLIFYFTAPSRIDFRELVKDLVRKYHVRIELRQIGVRHETQLAGSLGNCGMVCCCRRFLQKFSPVTIRMAKEQNLFLNPTKISGSCGRLLCCLAYEQDNYDNFYRNCPRFGKKYKTKQGDMKILRANMFRNSISVLAEGGEEKELSLEEWHALAPSRPEPCGTRGASSADNDLLDS